MTGRPLVRAIAVLWVSLAIVGCGDDGVGPENSFTGRYDLISVNGESVPYVMAQVGNHALEMTAGFLQLNNDETFSTAGTFRETVGGSVSTYHQPASGSWTRTGDQVSLTYSNGSVDTAVVSGNQLTVTSDGVSFVFRK